MSLLYESPLNNFLALFLFIISIISAWLCINKFIKAYRHAGEYDAAQWFIRGIRWLLIALTSGAWSASFFWKQKWLFIIGLVIICQELYEGVMISSALRNGADLEKKEKKKP